MESIEIALFENPLYLYISLAIAELVLTAIWYERRTRRWAVSLAIPILLAAGIFALETLVVTDREQITTALKEIAAEMQNLPRSPVKLPVTERHLDETVRVDLGGGFGGMNMTRDQSLQAGRKILEQFDIESVKFLRLGVKIDGGQAHTHFNTVITFDTPQWDRQHTSLIWNIHWKKRDGCWRIVRIEKPQRGLEF